MKKLNVITLLVIILQSITSIGFAQSDYQYFNKFKVKLKPESNQEFSSISPTLKSSSRNLYLQTALPSVNQLNQEFGMNKMERLFPESGKFENKHRAAGLHLWYVLSIESDDPKIIQQCINKYAKDAHIEHAEGFYKVHQINPETAPVKQNYQMLTDSFPNDTLFNQQWHYKNKGQDEGLIDADIDLEEAWAITTGDTNVVVAIIDGGVDYNHSDLADAMWVNNAEANGQPGVDDDNNGFIDDIHGWSFVNDSAYINPTNHGTHVGGTVGAVSNNTTGVAGVAGGDGNGNGVRLMSCAVFLNNSMFTPSGGFENAFVYAADNGAVIAQNSWGVSAPDIYEQSILDAIDYFVANAGYDENGYPKGPMQGGIVIFAAGNDNSNGNHYPGCYESVVAVAATDNKDERAWFSNYGNWVDVAAPGVNILSTLPDNEYEMYHGTSMACPHVSGVAGLIVSKFKNSGITPNEVRKRLTNLSDNIDTLNIEYETQLGVGRLNAYKALQPNTDSIAPNAISNLQAMSSTQTTLTINWIAPGDDDTVGVALKYDSRISFDSITSENFSKARKYSPFCRPKKFGDNHMFELEGLLPDTTYYMAIKTMDEWENWSNISNVASIRTQIASEIVISDSMIHHTQDTGFVDSVIFTVKNSGKDTLKFQIDFLQSQSLNPIENRFKNEPILLVINEENNSARELLVRNPFNGKIIDRILLPEVLQNRISPYAIAYDGECIFLSSVFDVMEAPYIYRLNINGELIDSIMVDELSHAMDMSINNGSLFVGEASVMRISEVNLRTQKRVREFITNPNLIWGLTALEKNNRLLATGSNVFYEYDLANGAVFFSDAEANEYVNYGYSYKMNALYAARQNDDVVDVIDPISKEIIFQIPNFSNVGIALMEYNSYSEWLTIGNANTEIVVEPGVEIEIPFVFNSNELNQGTFNDYFYITSNDPINERISVPVKFVTQESEGSGEAILTIVNDTIDFDVVAHDSVSFTITNTGTKALQVSGIGALDSVIMVSQSCFSLEPSETKQIWLKAEDYLTHSIETPLFVFSNDENEPYKKLWLEVSKTFTEIDHSKLDQISVFPNPAQNIVHIENIADKSRISIYTPDGKLKTQVQNVSNKAVVDVSDFPNGIYLIQITNEYGKSCHKIVIQ